MTTDGAVPGEVLDAYQVGDGEIEVLQGGRTNRTLHVRAGRDLVLQQLGGPNDQDLLGVMENLVRVTSHLEWKHAFAEGRETETWWPQLAPTASGKPFLIADDGALWRAFAYRPGRIARGELSVDELVSAAALFGRLSGATVDIDDPPLIETAPGFHELSVICERFEATCAQADGERLHEIDGDRADLDALLRRLETRCDQDGLHTVTPRVVHNDTKLSNVLLALDEPTAIALLDFDLVMMGPIWHDVGDFLRSAAWHSGTDGRPSLPLEVFAPLVRSYAEAMGATLRHDELATFAVAAPRLAFELGLRYLGDHLRDEPDLRVGGPHGHLRRGRANVKLAEEMLNAYDALRSMVDTIDVPGHHD